MSFTKVLSTLFLFCLLSSPLLAQNELSLDALGKLRPNATKTERKKTEQKPQISSITIEGNKNISTEKIKQELTFQTGDEFANYKLNRNVKNIQKMGYFSKVDGIHYEDTKGVHISFSVKENPILEEVIITGNTLYTTEELLADSLSETGEIYNIQHTRKDIKLIEKKYHENGYVYAKVYRIANPDKNSNALTFYLGEGVIESITITGNHKTQSYVIERELDFEEGAIINQETLKKNIRRIYNLGYFKNVNPKLLPGSTTTSHKIVLDIDERESTGSFSVGGGFSPTTGFSLFSDLNWDNVNGTGQLLMLKGSFGLGGDSQSRQNTYQFKYHNPWAWDKRRSFTFRTWLTEGRSFSPLGNSSDFIQQIRRGLDVEFGIPHSYELRSSHKLKYESVTLPEDEDDNIKAENYSIYSYTYGLGHDTRDYRLNPRKGHYHSGSIEQAFKFRKTAIDFTKLHLTLRQFIPTFKKQTIALRTQFRYLRSPEVSRERVFRTEYYYVGGSTTVRGYDDLNPFGIGNKSVVSNLEYRFLFTDNFQTILFIDAGQASLNSDVLNLSTYKIGKGVGLRLNVPPLGPIRLDLGITETGESRVHFNIGHTF